MRDVLFIVRNKVSIDNDNHSILPLSVTG